MGKLIKIKTSLIKPSQDFLKEKTIRHIGLLILENKLNDLPPAPIIRKHPSKEGYIAIDGHNLLAVKDLLNEECEVYIADSSNDKLEKNNFPYSTDEALESRNKDLEEKFETVLKDVDELAKKGVANFCDLRIKYEYLKNWESLKIFIQNK